MKEIYIENGNYYNRIAIKEDNILKECLIEEISDKPKIGEIYKGVVKNIVPAIKCAFIDIGLSKNVFMYMDIKLNNMKLKKGDEIIVQVIKEEVENKEAKVTPVFSIPGHYSVISYPDNKITFSKKINDDNFKDNINKSLNSYSDIGIKIRTAAQYADIEDIKNEINEIKSICNNIILKGRYSLKPIKLYSDKGILDRVLRDYILNNDLNIIADSEEDIKYINDYAKNNSLSCNTLLYSGKINIFDYYGIEKDIIKLREKRVNLKCGGYIVIDKTEAMHVIDVNSGKNIRSSNIEKTAYITNSDAAEEAARQIRLRNLSGIIIIDFIDMKNLEYKLSIMDILKSGFYNDKVPVTIFPFTQLNLIQIARQKKGMSITDFILTKCNYCRGRGDSLSFEYMCLIIKNSIKKSDDLNLNKYYIEIPGHFREKIMNNIADFICKIDAFNKTIYVKYKNKTDLPDIKPIIFENEAKMYEEYRIFG